jgi:hypothetical protein
MVRKFPAPAGILTPVKDKLLPAEAFAPQVAVPLAAQLIVTPVIDAGITSTTPAPIAFEGPEFDTTIVYVIALPGV